MKIIVTTKNIDLNGFVVIKSLEKVDWGKVEVIIFHETIDTELNTILNLTEAAKHVEKTIYINKDLNNLYYVLFQGMMKGDIFTDEEFLDDAETLQYLIDNYKRTGMGVKPVNAEIEKIIQYLSEISTSNLEIVQRYLKSEVMQTSINKSLVSVQNTIEEKEELENQMITYFQQSLDFITEFMEDKKKQEESIQKLKTHLEDLEIKRGLGTESRKFIFPTYPVPNSVPKVLYIRALSPVIYLQSFMIAYLDYLKNERRKRVKMLIATPMLKLMIEKYKHLPNISPESVKTVSLNTSDLFVTHEPTSEVLNKFFNGKEDIYIVVDLMYGEPLLTGAKTVKVTAVQGVGDISKHGLDVTRTITPISGYSNGILIPRISGYHEMNEVQRLTTYATKVNSATKTGAYAKLDRLIEQI